MEEQPDVGKLDIKSIERNSEVISYEMQWTLFNYSRVEPNKMHTMHSILVGNKVCHFKFYKKQKDDGGEDLALTEIILTFMPSALSSVYFSIVGANNLKFFYPQPPDISTVILRKKKEAYWVEASALIVNDTLTVSVLLTLGVGQRRGLSIFESIEKSNSHLGNLRQSGLFADMKIVVGKKKFPAHRAILCARSSVMAAMFESKLTENNEKVLVINDADAETVEEMLNYIYTDQTKNLNPDLALNLFRLAKKYHLTGLESQVATFLMGTMKINSAIKTLVLADEHSHQDLKDKAIEFIGKNLFFAMRHETWDHLWARSDLLKQVLEYVSALSVGRRQHDPNDTDDDEQDIF